MINKLYWLVGKQVKKKKKDQLHMLFPTVW